MSPVTDPVARTRRLAVLAELIRQDKAKLAKDTAELATLRDRYEAECLHYDTLLAESNNATTPDWRLGQLRVRWLPMQTEINAGTVGEIRLLERQVADTRNRLAEWQSEYARLTGNWRFGRLAVAS